MGPKPIPRELQRSLTVEDLEDVLAPRARFSRLSGEPTFDECETLLTARYARVCLMRPHPNTAASYVVAVAAVAAALLLKVFFTGLGADHPFVLLPAAVIVAAWYGGRGPGLVAAVLAAVGTDLLFLAPTVFGATGADLPGLLGLLVETILIVEITVRLRTAQKRARDEAQAANAARHELSLALRLREELLAFWSEKLHGPLTHLVFGLRAARVAVEEGNKPQALMALDGVVDELQAVQRTTEQWLDRTRMEGQAD